MSTTQPEALRENYTAADMATAAAQGFRDGAASVAASAGSEPVAHLWQHSETGRTRVVMPDMVVDASATWLPVGPLYLHPSPPEGAGWKWVPKILSAEMVDAWASARLPGGIAQMTDDEANRAVAQANWDSMIAAAPPPPAQAADSVLEDADPIRALIGQHAAILAQNESAYFELCYHRTTGWMSWITDKPLCMPPVVNPDRKVLAQGQGDTADEACRDAARRQGGA